MIEIIDLYDAITFDQNWATIIYLIERLEHRGVYVNRTVIHDLYSGHVEASAPDVPRYVPVVPRGTVVIDTRDDGSNPAGIFDPFPAGWRTRMVRESREANKTPRQVLRDTEEAI